MWVRETPQLFWLKHSVDLSLWFGADFEATRAEQQLHVEENASLQNYLKISYYNI